MDRQVMRMGVDAPEFRPLMQLMDSAPSQKSMELASLRRKKRVIDVEIARSAPTFV